uniref:Uncharacterized protein n=1 Tax=Vespula pensylvanica TaxID=30213 RepID=A0A834U4D8_VESPE|nr:hypothetical protein H0235_012330 [Vespula pensylvanica]
MGFRGGCWMLPFGERPCSGGTLTALRAVCSTVYLRLDTGPRRRDINDTSERSRNLKNRAYPCIKVFARD